MSLLRVNSVLSTLLSKTFDFGGQSESLRFVTPRVCRFKTGQAQISKFFKLLVLFTLVA